MTTSIVTTESTSLSRTRAPALPLAPAEYERQYQDQLNNILRLYFNTLDNLIGQLTTMASINGSIPVALGGTNLDAFGRLRVSNPYTLFDSQNRFAKDNQFSETLATSGTATYNADESSVDMAVTTASGSTAIRQSLRCMPYQPGKGLLVLCTFVMNEQKENLRQRVGYFNAGDGVFLNVVDEDEPEFVIRTSTSGSPSDARAVAQGSWNGDKLDGTGPSGLTLDLTKAQILWMDFEWLGVGSVRCGFIIDGQYIVCHTFDNANDNDKVYMTTAILPVRYEIENTGATASASTLTQICSTVISEGGYGQVVAPNTARRTAAKTSIGTTFLPIVAIRLKSTKLNAVVLPHVVNVLPTANGDYEVVLARLDDDSSLTSVSWVNTDFENVEYDVSATAVTITAAQIVDNFYLTATNQSSGVVAAESGYNFDMQIGATLANVSQVYVLAVRTLSSTGSAIGSLSFYDLTQ
jgi:hypothetical protein